MPDMVYRSKGPLVQKGESGIEEQIYAADMAIQEADRQGRMQLSQGLVDGMNKLTATEFQNNMQEELANAYSENATNPVEFKKNADAIEKGLLKGTPFSMKQQLRDVFAQQSQRYYLKAVDGQNKVQNDKLLESTIRSQGNAALLAQEAVSDILSDNDSIKIKGIESFAEAMQQFNEDMNQTDSYGMPLFNANQRLKAEDSFRGSIFSELAFQKLEKIEGVDEKQKYINSVREGKASFDLGDQSISSKSISQQQRNAVNKRLNDRMKQFVSEQKEGISLSFVQSVIDGKEFPDPKDKQYREQVDVYYKNQLDLKNIDVSDPEQRNAAANSIGQLINETKAVPPSLEGQLRALLNSDNPDYYSLAASITGNISANNPELMQYIPEKDISKALRMNDLVLTGMDVKDAYTSVNDSFKIVSKEVATQRVKDFNRDIANNPSLVDPNIMEHGYWFFREMQEPASNTESLAFSNELKSLAREEYIKGNSLEGSLESAKLIMLNNWGNSNINGKDQLMSRPPEKYYAVDEVGIDSKWMKQKAFNYAKEMSGDKSLKSDEVIVLADKITYQQSGNSTSKPTYSIYSLKNGSIDPILDKNFNQVRVGENIWRDQEALDMYNAPAEASQEEIKQALDELKESSAVKKSKNREMKNKLTLEFQKAQFSPML